MSDKSKRCILIAALESKESGVGLCADLKGRELIRYVLNMCEEIPFVEDVFVISNNEEALDFCRPTPLLKAIEVGCRPVENSPEELLPVGGCRDLFEHVELAEDTTVALVSAYAPFIAAPVLSEAIRKVDQGRSRVSLSMAPCRKHPVLLFIQPNLYQSMEQYPLDHMWTRKGASIVDSHSMATLEHRQDYPLVLEADRSFIVFKWKDRDSLQNLVRTGEACAEITPAEASLVISGPLDLIHANVVLENPQYRSFS